MTWLFSQIYMQLLSEAYLQLLAADLHSGFTSREKLSRVSIQSIRLNPSALSFAESKWTSRTDHRGRDHERYGPVHSDCI